MFTINRRFEFGLWRHDHAHTPYAKDPFPCHGISVPMAIGGKRSIDMESDNNVSEADIILV